MRVVKQHNVGARDYSASIWALLMFEAFMRSVLGAAPAAGGTKPAASASLRLLPA